MKSERGLCYLLNIRIIKTGPSQQRHTSPGEICFVLDEDGCF
jgi:hypothetical protein